MQLDGSACFHSDRKRSGLCTCQADRQLEAHRSWDVSQSTKVTRIFCTASDSAVGVGTGGGAWWAEEELAPFMTRGGRGTSAVPLLGRAARMAVNRVAAFS